MDIFGGREHYSAFRTSASSFVRRGDDLYLEGLLEDQPCCKVSAPSLTARVASALPAVRVGFLRDPRCLSPGLALSGDSKNPC